VLDIGSGTGLLLMMMAQQMTGWIDGVEMEQSAVEESCHNIEVGPWSDRITVHHADIRAYRSVLPYDLIVSNPPFFHGDL
jgi:tRNA1Val (adenine37-N6)-methyltransferase